MKAVTQLIQVCVVIYLASGFSVYAGTPTEPNVQTRQQAIQVGGIEIKAPDIAENGDVVPIAIKSVKHDKNAYVKQLWFYNEHRKEPVAYYTLNERSIPVGISSRIKLPKDNSKVSVVAEMSDGKMIGGQKEIKVVKEGCGG